MTKLPALPKSITGSGAKQPAHQIQPLIQGLRQRGQVELADSLAQLIEYADALGNMLQVIRDYLQQLTTSQSGISADSWVSSVDLTVPAILQVSGGPITGAGVLAVSLADQSANLIFAGPTSGGAADPTFRAMVTADKPNVVTAHTIPVGKTGGTVDGSITWNAKGDVIAFVDPT